MSNWPEPSGAELQEWADQITDPLDDKLAALHERVCLRLYQPMDNHEIGHHGYFCDAAAILGERGVFLPDGQEAQVLMMAEGVMSRDRTIATLRAALDGLVSAGERTSGYLDHCVAYATLNRSHVACAGIHDPDVIEAARLRAALATAKDVPK